MLIRCTIFIIKSPYGGIMTLILACAHKYNKILIRGDKRSIDAETGEIVTEHQNKVFPINSRCHIAFAGYSDVTNELFRYLLDKYPKKWEWDPEKIFYTAYLYRILHPSEHNMEMLICGYDINEDPLLYVIYSDTKTMKIDLSQQRIAQIGYHDEKFQCDINDTEDNISNQMEAFIKKISQKEKSVGSSLRIDTMAPSFEKMKKLREEIEGQKSTLDNQ